MYKRRAIQCAPGASVARLWEFPIIPWGRNREEGPTPSIFPIPPKSSHSYVRRLRLPAGGECVKAIANMAQEQRIAKWCTAESFPSGLRFYLLSAAGLAETHKMVLLK